MLEPINFLCPLKQKLDDYRNGETTLNEMLDFLYGIDPNLEKKVVRLQKKFKKDREKLYYQKVQRWKKRN